MEVVVVVVGRGQRCEWSRRVANRFLSVRRCASLLVCGGWPQMAPLFFCSLVHRQWHAVARARDGPTASHATRRTKHGHEASSALTASSRMYGGHLVLFYFQFARTAVIDGHRLVWCRSRRLVI